MFAHVRIALLPALCGLVLACSTAPARAAGFYTLTDLGGDNSQAHGINNLGQVVGSDGPFPNRTAFLYQNGSMSYLPTLGGVESAAVDINDAGQIVGGSHTSDGDFHAFLYENGEMKDLGTFGGKNSEAQGINSAGQIVGAAEVAGRNSYRAFLYENEEMIDLGTLGGNRSYASAINENGQIVGLARNTDKVYRAFLSAYDADSDDWKMIDLGSLGGDKTSSSATAINDAGQVAGSSQFEEDNTNNHAFLYENGEMKDLGTLGGDQSAAFGINNAGHVVGFSQTANNEAIHAFLYNGVSTIDLNTLIDPDLGWKLTHALAINDHGQIVGYGVNAEGVTRAFLLNPVVPEPSSVALMALGLAGLAGVARRRGRSAR